MKSLVIFDSQFGNTEKIAQTIGEELGAKVINVQEASLDDLNGVKLLIIGSPTQGERAKINLQTFINQIPTGTLKNINIAAFDTLFLEKNLIFPLRFLVKTIGYASPKIADILKDKNGKLIVPPERFIVKGKEGPLAQEELERARKWAKRIIEIAC